MAPRSRSPRREGGGFLASAAAAWSAASKALKSTVAAVVPDTDAGPAREPVAAESVAAEEAETKAAPEPVEEPAVKEPDADTAADTGDEAAPCLPCFACGQRFKDMAQLQTHLESEGINCLSAVWQAAVNAIGCMPGAGTTLWCPACPETFLGKWTGSVAKASALLRHAAACSKTGVPESAPKAHGWFLRAFVALLLSSPPPPLVDDEGNQVDESTQEMRLQEWIGSNPPLMNIVGPLLAKPGPEAREAVRAELEKCELSESAPWPFGDAAAAAPVEGKKKSKKKKAETAAPGYDLYNEDIPMDVFMACEDHTRRTSDGVPVLDLLSSDEDELTQL